MRSSIGLLVIGSTRCPRVGVLLFRLLSRNTRPAANAANTTNPPTDIPAIAAVEIFGPSFEFAAAVVVQVLEPDAQGVALLVEDWRAVATDTVEPAVLETRLDVTVVADPNRLIVQCWLGSSPPAIFGVALSASTPRRISGPEKSFVILTVPSFHSSKAQYWPV